MTAPNELELLKRELLEATRLYLWYTGSEHSYFKGKANKAQAEQQMTLMGFYNREIVKHRGR